MPHPTPAARTARRVAASKRRRTVIIIAAMVAIVGAAGVVVATSGSGSDDAVANSAPVTIPAPTVTTTPPPTTAATPLPAEVATTKVPSLQVFDAPDSTQVITSLSDKTDYLLPRTLLVTEQRGDWLKALLPMRPNESEGWIRQSDVTVSQNPYRITVNLADHLVTLYKDGQEILHSPAVVGADRTPTPLGTFYITDPIDLRSRPGGAYGAYALGLSGYSEVLFEFNGGPGQIAIHGTNNPELVGQNVSNGCVRVPNDMIVEIARQAPLGTPVVIT
jgi:lipoprotein-anchoring transpeptidase ErfK/SrfK